MVVRVIEDPALECGDNLLLSVAVSDRDHCPISISIVGKNVGEMMMAIASSSGQGVKYLRKQLRPGAGKTNKKSV